MFGVGTAVATEQPRDRVFENLAPIRNALEAQARSIMDKSGGAVQVQIDSLSYDKTRHVLWFSERTTSSMIGEIHGLSAAYVTREGTLQTHCYAQEWEWEKRKPECRRILESVELDAAITIPPLTPIPDLFGMSKPKAEAMYQELTARAKAGDLGIDFRALRYACAYAKRCENADDRADMTAAGKAGAEERWTDMAAISERMIGQNFANVLAHAYCVTAYTKLNLPEKAKPHLAIVTGYVRSILDSGDGKSPETAIDVVSARDEQMALSSLLNVYGKPVEGAVVFTKEHWYHEEQLQDSKTQKITKLYFNVEVFYNPR